MIGFYTALRISDILKLKVRDVKTGKLNIREQKTGKQKLVAMNPQLISALRGYTEKKKDGEYLIKSREGTNRPITRQQACNIVKIICEDFGIYNVGTHTMRKTFGYHYYKKTKNIALLQLMYNHTHPSVTLRYIGITSDNIDSAIVGFKY